MPKILIIDDDTKLLETTKILVINFISGCNVLTATDGNTGYEIAVTEQPDVILLDLELPVIDGFQTCQNIKNNDKTKHIPVLMLTGVKISSEHRIRGLESGADVFLTKPIHKDELLAQINVALRIKNVEDQLRNKNKELEHLIKQRTQSLQKTELYYHTLVEASQDGIFLFDLDGIILDCNTRACDLVGTSKEKLVSTSILDTITDDAIQNILQLKDKALNNETFLETLARDKNGIEFPVEVSTRFIRVNGDKTIVAYIRDITERKRAENIQQVIFEISDAANTSQTMKELFERIQAILHTVIDTTNFYICLYNKKDDTLLLPYFIDDNDDYKALPAGKTLTKYIITNNTPLLASESTVEDLIKQGEIEDYGTPSKIWMGVPLKSNKVIGAIVVQSYTDPNLYTEEHLEILKFVSDQIALAIERKEAENQIKASLKEKEVLLKEIHHRVKNNLQIVSSLLHFQTKRIKDPNALELIKISQNRIRVMALVHESLYYTNDLSHIDFGKYIKKLTSHLFKTFDENTKFINMNVKAENIFLSIEIAIPCALIVNELVTNSVKYAFKNQSKRKIDVIVNLLSQKSEEQDQYQLIVQDNGIGIPEDTIEGKTQSFGMKLVSNLCAQLDGELKICSEKGTKICITFPVDR